MFGYQLVKRFPSPGYEVWDVWRKPYLSTGMNLGWTEEEMTKWLPTKLCGWALNAVSDLSRGYWRSTSGKQAWTLIGTLYQFDIRLPDNPLFYEQSDNLFVRGKAGSRAKFIETSNTVDQRTRQQCSRKQVIDTKEAMTLLWWLHFGNPAKNLKGLELGPAAVYQEKKFSVKILLEKRKIRELLRVVVE